MRGGAALGLAILLAAGAGARALAEPADPELAALEGRARALLADFRARDGFPGAVAAFALPDGRVGRAAVGFADPERGIRMAADHRSMSGSTGKTFVAALALALAREGRLELDAPIPRWLGEEPWFDRLPSARRIRLHHLLRHSAGLEDHVFQVEFVLRALWRRLRGGPDAFLAPRELVEIVLDEEPLFAPGAGYHYSDTGYILVGMILERATGRDYEALLAQRFLRPLGLEDTEPADRRDLERLVAGHQSHVPLISDRAVDAQGRLRFHPRVEWTGEGLVTTAADLGQWARALYGGHALPGDYGSALVEDAVPVRAGLAYGLGVFVYEETPLGPALGHGGWFPGYRTQMIYYREPRLAFALQLNVDGGVAPREYSRAIARAVLEALPGG